MYKKSVDHFIYFLLKVHNKYIRRHKMNSLDHKIKKVIKKSHELQPTSLQIYKIITNETYTTFKVFVWH